MSLNILKELSRIPEYQEVPLYYNDQETNFKMIVANGKVVSVVSKAYQLIQSREVFKEFLTSLPQDKITGVKICTNMVKHYLYIRTSQFIGEARLMFIAINSVDKSNALKLLTGIFVQECANDLAILKGIYIKHIGKKLQVPKFEELIQATIQRLEYLKAKEIELYEEDKKKILLLVNKWERNKLKEYLVANKYSAFEFYQKITTHMWKNYRLSYFNRLQVLYNLISSRIKI